MVNNPEELISRLSSTSDAKAKLSLLDSFCRSECRDPNLFNKAGLGYYRMGRYEDAIGCFKKATGLQPDLLPALVNLGACYNEIGNQAAAIRCYRQALEVNDTNSGAWANLGKAYNDAGEFEMAVYCLHRARELIEQSDNAQGLVSVLLGLARAYHLGGRDDRARTVLEKAVELAPENPHAHHSLASIYFHFGEYPAALREFEWRLRLPTMETHRRNLPGIFQKPACTDGNPGDKTLLLYTEQGFGDSIQFARFVKLLKPRVKRLVMWSRPGLADLFRHSLDVDEISGDRDRLPEFDLQFSLLSIPYHCDPALESLDTFSPYLFAPGATDFDVKRHAGLNIGLVWGADKAGYDYRNKAVPLEQLVPLLQIPGTCWYSLQVGDESGDIGRLELKERINDLSGQLTDFSRTADAVDQLDLVITTDTAVAHLAGAMGRPVWVLLKKNPDWRWDSGSERSAWYPSARLFRQNGYGDWSHVVTRLQSAIIQRIGNRPIDE